MKPKDLLDHLEKFGSERVMAMLKRPERAEGSLYSLADQIGQLSNLMAQQSVGQMLGVSSGSGLQQYQNYHVYQGGTIQPRQGYQAASPFESPWR